MQWEKNTHTKYIYKNLCVKSCSYKVSLSPLILLGEKQNKNNNTLLTAQGLYSLACSDLRKPDWKQQLLGELLGLWLIICKGSVLRGMGLAAHTGPRVLQPWTTTFCMPGLCLPNSNKAFSLPSSTWDMPFN